MDLGEKLFGWLHSGSERRKGRHFELQRPLRMQDSPQFERLNLVSRALNERSLRLHLSDAIELPDAESLYLPRELALSCEERGNFSIYLYRVMAFHGALSGGSVYSLAHAGPTRALIESARVAPRLHRELGKAYSGFDELLTEVRRLSGLASKVYSDFDSQFEVWGWLIERALSTEDSRITEIQEGELIRAWRKDWTSSPFCPIHALLILPNSLGLEAAPPGEANSKAHSLPDKGALRKANSGQQQVVRIKTVARPEVKKLSEQEENPVTHVFEKLLTAEEHKGGSKTQDGSDENNEHADALSELTLESVTRTQAGADCTLKAGVQIDARAPELEAPLGSSNESIHLYPEWFNPTRTYKPDFCTVYESTLPESSAGLVGGDAIPARSDMTEKLSSFLNESRWKPRQKSGPEFDLDAIVRWRSQLKGSGPVDQRIYVGRRRLERDLAILILLDSSLSTDAWIGNQRVLDVMRSSVELIGDAFDQLDDRFAIGAFNSYSRHRCDFKWVKRFNDTWTSSRPKLRELKPDGYTRIGPSLRHAHAHLKKIKARKKLLLLFSDAKPSDYDHYEGEHGLADVQKAVAEIRSSRIFMKGVTVSQEGRGSLTRMFGAGQYQSLSSPNEIANRVLQIFIEMMR